MSAVFALLSCSTRIPAVTFGLATGVYLLGRSSKCDLVIRDNSISRRHAELVVMEETVGVRDLNSRNGIFVNGIRVGNAEVEVGDRVNFGRISVKIEASIDHTGPEDSGLETPRHRSMAPSSKNVLGALSAAQQRVFDLLLEGLPEKKVAIRLNLSPTTVHNHIQAIYRIFKVHSRSELLVSLLRVRR